MSVLDDLDNEENAKIFICVVIFIIFCIFGDKVLNWILGI